jgi:hypothetical protein
MRTDWISKLQHMLQVIAFGLVVATIQYAFTPERPYGPGVVYSVLISLIIWAIIDLGRDLVPSSRETGWPRGWSAIALVGGAIAAGWYFGNLAGDALCRTFHLFGPRPPVVDAAAEIRSGILVTIIASIVASYWFYSQGKSEYLARKMGEARRHAEEARLKLLETQLEPHMLFNTLANLRALIAVDPERAQQMLDHMIAYLRATLDASRATTHPLGSEFERLRDYLELMAIRMGPRLTFTLELPPELAGLPVPTLLLQPLVENSIQHGLEPKVQGGRIHVRARSADGQLVIEVEDSGVGTGSGKSKGPGFGLTQIRERLAALYGAAASLDFATSPAGAQARISLPIA